MNFADRLADACRQRSSIAMLGVDPHLDTADSAGLPRGYTLTRFCCEVVEACAPFIAVVKPQLAFYEARGVEGMRTFVEVIRTARRLGLLVIADAKRGDIGSTSEAYAEAFLGDGEFACDAVTVNPYQGSDTVAPFIARARNGRGVFILVRTSNPSSGEFQDVDVGGSPLWESICARVNDWGRELVGTSGLSSIGAVLGATYPEHARRARKLMPLATVLVPGYGAQGASADDAVAAALPNGSGIVVNASRSLMYAFRNVPGKSAGEAAAIAAARMRDDLNRALAARAQTDAAASV